MASPRIRSAVAVALLSIATVGCGGLPDRIESVEQARESIAAVSREPLAGRVATEELEAAREALASADAAYEEDEPLELIEHRAYVAQRYADISRERVSEAQAREEAARGEAERNRIIAESRTRQAETALRAAEAAQLAAETAQRTAADAARELDVQTRAVEEQTRAVEEQARATQAAEQRASQLERELADLQARNTDRGLVLTLGDVLFDTGQSTLKPGAHTTIDRLAQLMGDYPDRSVRVEGHTDSAGSDETNQLLSERRASTVRDALVARGVDMARIQTVGYGEARPIAGNDTPDGRQQNRRIEIVVSDAQGNIADGAPRSAAQ